MFARDREFTVEVIMQVPVGASLRGFPEFPRAGTLVVLNPPCAMAETELTGYSAQVATGTRTLLLRYLFWQLNPAGEIGLLCKGFDEATIPLGSKVTFIKRARLTAT